MIKAKGFKIIRGLIRIQKEKELRYISLMNIARKTKEEFNIILIASSYPITTLMLTIFLINLRSVLLLIVDQNHRRRWLELQLIVE